MIERLAHLLRLEEGWDGYGGRPTERGAVKMALLAVITLLTLVPDVPFIAPLVDGGLQLEWESGLILIIPPSGTHIEYLIDDGPGNEVQGEGLREVVEFLERDSLRRRNG